MDVLRKRSRNAGRSLRLVVSECSQIFAEARDRARGTDWYPWLVRELRVTGIVSGILVLSMWAKRIVEQSLGSSWLNEHIMRGGTSDVVRDIEGRFA